MDKKYSSLNFITMKAKYYLLFAVMSISISIFTGNATPDIDRGKDTINEKIRTMTREQRDVRIAEIKTRITEIRTMDKSNLNREERKKLRKEVRSLVKEGRQISSVDGTLFIAGSFICTIMLVMIVLA